LINKKKAGAKGAPWDGVRNYQAAKKLTNIYLNSCGFESLLFHQHISDKKNTIRKIDYLIQSVKFIQNNYL